ncbi:MAG TPA: AcrB/AcrD/AcrF family protein [Porticoccaceae bacterium]|nr:AcrB/AcrD/AcrF family protein [Porticoccaceae bacterium]
MKPIIRFFAERHLFSYLFSLSVILLGVGSLLSIPRDNLPNVDLRELFITTIYPGASPQDVEVNVTSKIEDELKEIDGIDKMTSLSMENLSRIHIKLDQNYDDPEAIKRDIRNAVNRVNDLPEEVDEDPQIHEIKTSGIPIIEVGLTGDIPYRELREHARRLEKKLLEVPGVAQVNKYGWRDREVKIEVSAEKMADLQLPVQQVAQAIAQRNIRASAGSLESYTDAKNIVALAEFEEPGLIGDVIVRTGFDGPNVRVRDVAQISDDFEKPDILSRMNGHSAISFLVDKKESADIIRTVKAVRILVDEQQAELGEHITFVLTGDTSRLVKNRIEVVQSNGLMGLVLVGLVLVVFLNKRSAFWVAMGLPVALFGALFLLPVFDVTLDSITLAAMAIVIGIIVDDAIVISENISRHLAMGKSPVEAAVDGASEVFMPVLTTIITTILAFSPLFFMEGMLGRFIYVIPLVVVLALMVSFFESTLALPSHLTHLARGNGGVKTIKTGWFERVLKPLFETLIYRVLCLRYLMIGLFVALLGGSLWYAANKMHFELFPAKMGDEFHIQMELPHGSSLRATADKVTEVERLLETLPQDELDSFVTRIGINHPFGGGLNDNFALITVYLTPFAQRERNIEQIVADLRVQVQALPGYRSVVFQMETGGPPVGRPVTVSIVGNDDARRAELTARVVAFLGEIDGVTDIDRDDKGGKEQIVVELDYDRLARLGLTVADIARTLRLAYDGETVTRVRYVDEEVAFRVMLDSSARSSDTALAALLVPNRQGRLVRLDRVAQFQEEPGPADVRHFDRERATTVTGDIVKGVTTPIQVAEQIQTHFNPLDWPDLQLVIGGEAEESQDSMKSLVIAFVTAIVGIFFVLILLFNSLIQPLFVLMAVPFGLVGVIAAFLFHGEPLGFVAMTGVIGLVGVLVNDSLILVDFVNKMREQNNGQSMRQIIAAGTAVRLRPIVITSITTGAGLLPMAYGLGGTDPFMAPMALAMGWGIFLATPITLVLMPCLLLIQDDGARVLRWVLPQTKKGRRV